MCHSNMIETLQHDQALGKVIIKFMRSKIYLHFYNRNIPDEQVAIPVEGFLAAYLEFKI